MAREAGAAEAEDDQLMVLFASGDQAAARLLTSRHASRVMRLARRMLNDEAEAEDVAQESMLRLWRMAPEWRPGETKVSTWLHRVATNLCYDRLRRRRDQPLDDEAASEIPDPDLSALERMEQEERAKLTRAAIDELPERQKAALTLRHFVEASNEEAAAALGVSVEAVESLLARARRGLKASLAARLGGWSGR